ncbi:MAG: glycosyltransferase family 61 protein [Synergistaceae bacterium]|nr:glycosyltransferase family 61 protein [Synergistaceae bacterium]
MTRIGGKAAHLGLAGLERNDYHWLCECLVRLHLIRKSGFRPEFYVVSNALDFQKEWLELLGIQERQIIPANAGITIQADELIVPSFVNNWERIEFREGYPNYQKQWLPRWIGDLYSGFRTESGNGRERVYISRANAPSRKVVNEDSLLPLLGKYGFTVVRSENLTVREQIETFANAEAVAGPHGAGLANRILCPPHASVLEIYPQYYYDSSYRTLLSALNLRYCYMVGETSDTSMPPQQENVRVAPEKFEAALKMLIS